MPPELHDDEKVENDEPPLSQFSGTKKERTKKNTSEFRDTRPRFPAFPNPAPKQRSKLLQTMLFCASHCVIDDALGEACTSGKSSGVRGSDFEVEEDELRALSRRKPSRETRLNSDI